MSYTRRIIMAQKGVSNDMTEVYAYAQSVGITSQQVDAALADKPAIIREKLIVWKYLLHSLVDTGYTPWLKGDGVAYINTGVIPKTNSTITFRIEPASSSQIIMGARVNTVDIDNSYMIVSNSNRIRGDWYACNKNVYSSSLTRNDVCTVSAGVIYINGVLNNSYSRTKAECNYPIYLFFGNTRSTLNTSNVFTGGINHVILDGTINGVDGSCHFVPYLDNGSYGMLDLVTGSFYGSAAPNGLFTYVLEDTNGNQVNLQ